MAKKEKKVKEKKIKEKKVKTAKSKKVKNKSKIFISITETCLSRPFKMLSTILSTYIKTISGDSNFTYLIISVSL